MRYAVVSPSGAIRYMGNVPDMDALALQGGDALAVECPEWVRDDTHYFNGVGWAAYPPKPGEWATWTGAEWADLRTIETAAADLSQAITRAVRRINDASAAIRLRYITDLPGQMEVYREKEAEAVAYLAAVAAGANINPDDYGLIQSEVGPIGVGTGETMDQVAQVYVNKAALMREGLRVLEKFRIPHINMAEAALTETSAAQAADGFVTLLEGLPI